MHSPGWHMEKEHTEKSAYSITLSPTWPAWEVIEGLLLGSNHKIRPCPQGHGAESLQRDQGNSQLLVAQPAEPAGARKEDGHPGPH